MDFSRQLTRHTEILAKTETTWLFNEGDMPELWSIKDVYLQVIVPLIIKPNCNETITINMCSMKKCTLQVCDHHFMLCLFVSYTLPRRKTTGLFLPKHKLAPNTKPSRKLNDRYEVSWKVTKLSSPYETVQTLFGAYPTNFWSSSFKQAWVNALLDT